MNDRIPLDHLTSDQLDELYADLDRYEDAVGDLNETVINQAREIAELRTVTRGYCPACGRGDAAPTVADWEQQRNRAQQLAAVLDEVLRHFVHKGHPGEPCLQTGWISEKTVTRWRTTLHQPQPATDSTEPTP